MEHKPKRLKPLMFVGTGSDVGKSIIAAAFCRIFRQDGYAPAPFKAQNMALNSYATPDGLEIGRAQAVQAEAAGIPCHTDMNPVLLKPNSDHTSQVVLNGRPAGNRSAREYFGGVGREDLRRAVHLAFDRLSERYDPIVMEGAGSVSELNLREHDIVNMPMAAYADAAVILVADIDRGGVFASVYGSIMLQPEEDRRRIKGVIINKFRGDMSLFDDGRAIIERLCGVPVLGVLPYFTDIHIDAEDSVALENKSGRAAEGCVNAAVVRLSHISNFTDFDALENDGRVHLYYTSDAAELAKADMIIIPGSKSTIADLAELHSNGVAAAVVEAARTGKPVVGICGGYQMLGREVCDPDGIEGGSVRSEGLSLLPVRTTITADKVTRQRSFRLDGDETVCRGYEIHQGRTELLEPQSCRPLAILDDGNTEGCICGCIVGTYLHGVLDNAPFIERLLAPFADRLGTRKTINYKSFRESQYDLLAERVRRYTDIDKIYKILQER